MKKLFLVSGVSILVLATYLSLSFLFAMPDQIKQQKNVVPVSDLASAPILPLEVDPTIPNQLYPCLAPKEDQNSLDVKDVEIKKITLLGQTEEKNQIYYYLNIDTASQTDFGIIFDSYRRLLKLSSDNQCSSFYSEDVYAPLSYYVSMSVARRLTLQWLQKEIERAGGKEKYQQELAESSNHAGMELVFSKEQIWAYKKLDIRIPRSYKVLSQPRSRSRSNN